MLFICVAFFVYRDISKGGLEDGVESAMLDLSVGGLLTVKKKTKLPGSVTKRRR